MRSPAELNDRLRARGLKLTPQRRCILGVLYGNDAHPTAESVHAAASAKLPGISLKTVYQTLHELVEMGELDTIDLGTGAVRFDPNIESAHQHVVCTGCGVVHDLEVTVDRLGLVAVDHQGFTVERIEVVVRGRCPGCAAATGPAAVGPAATAPGGSAG